MRVKTDSETGLLVFFLLVSGYMFVESYEFGSTAGLFPRLTSGVVFVGSVLLLFRNYLPGPMYTFVAESTELISAPGDVDTYAEELPEQPDERERDARRPVSPAVFTAVSIILYAVASFLVGMLWTSPLFVLVYTWWFRQPWYVCVALAALGFGLAYGFMTVLNLPLAEGWLLFGAGGW